MRPALGRRELIAGTLLALPFLALFGLARVAGPAVADWRARSGDAGFDTILRDGGPRDLALRVPRGAGAHAMARQAADAVDALLRAACDGSPAGLGLEPPGRAGERVQVAIIETDADPELRAAAGQPGAGVLEGGRGWCDPRTGRIFVLRGEPGLEAALRHQAAHLVLGEDVPPWLGEGLARYLETVGPGPAPPSGRGGRGEGGSSSPRDDACDDARKLAKGPRGLRLAEVLEADRPAFRGDASAPSAAAAEALVTWLLDAAGPDLRRRFLDHLRAARTGRGRGAEELEKALGMKTAALEEKVAGWLAPPAKSEGAPAEGR